MSLNLFIIGPSGSGKSTQAKMIADHYGLTHLSMGQILRDEIKENTPQGQQIQQYVDQGVPAPDNIVLPLITSKLSLLSNKNFIVDGFPRLISQGIYLNNYLKDSSSPLDNLIHLTVDFKEILKRRQNNPSFQKEDQDRSDNTPEAIANRQKVLYESNVNPILDFYRDRHQLIEVDGNRPVEPIFKDICSYIDQLLIKKGDKLN